MLDPKAGVAPKDVAALVHPIGVTRTADIEKKMSGMMKGTEAAGDGPRRFIPVYTRPLYNR